jgi:hypothetical protein
MMNLKHNILLALVGKAQTKKKETNKQRNKRKKQTNKQKKERNEEPIDTQKKERGSSKITSS